MKKTLKLTETELINVIKLITEQINFDDYSREDFIDVFLQVFRSWIFDKLGEDFKKYPISYLLKKYGPDFAVEKGLLHNNEKDDFDGRDIDYYGLELAQKSHYSLPSLYSNKKFTEKYKKIIPPIIESLKVPDFVKIDLIEDEPNRVEVRVAVDFGKWMKYPENIRVDVNSICDELINLFEKYVGVEFGNPAYGYVSMHPGKLAMDEKEWVNTELNNYIKKEIRKQPNSNTLQSIRFWLTGNGGHINLVFKTSSNIIDNRIFTEETAKLVKDLGYGPNLIVLR